MKVDPDEAGLDATRLPRIEEHFVRRYIETGRIAGCQVVVARHGSVGYSGSFGQADRERDTPVADDTIFRIYSMTKPVTGVALLTLYEHGHFQLGDPIHRWLPELENLKVQVHDEHGRSRLVDPERPVSVRDVLMHTSGFGYEALLPDTLAVTAAEADASLADPSFDLPAAFAHIPFDLAGLISRLSRRPLHFHPGSRWLYSVSLDVCARLIEVMSGQRFDEYLRSTILAPLGMVDTGFQVSDEDIDRFAALYRHTPDGLIELSEDPRESAYRKAPVLFMGGGGLVSTATDYLRFCQMLLNGGELDGTRILGAKTVELIGQNHLRGGVTLPEMALGYSEVDYDGMGFGLTVAVSQGPVATGVLGSAGTYQWGGMASTQFWIDPAEDLTVVFMTQLHPSVTYNFRSQLQALIYPAIIG